MRPRKFEHMANKASSIVKLLSVCLLLAWSFSHVQLMAQTVQLTDSIYRIFRHKPVLTAKFDSRNTFVTGNKASVWGIKVGLVYRKSLTVGIGYSWLQSEIYEKDRWNNEGPYYEARVRLQYIAPFIDYTFYRKGPWEVNLPVQLGFGKSWLTLPRQPQDLKMDWVVLYEPSMGVEYKFFKYFAVGGGYGYRIMLLNNKQLVSRFTSPMYVLRFRILFGELYKLYQKEMVVDE
jgi:hypothetical protein